MKQIIYPLILGITIVLSSIFLGNAYVKRGKTDNGIKVTGLGKTNFVSDLIVWGGEFFVVSKDLKTGYSNLQKNKTIIKEYLLEKGVSLESIIFDAVFVAEKNKDKYSDEGKYIGREFIAHKLRQSFTIESKEVDKIEKISREITELLNKGVQMYSSPPRYYYTKLANLKIEMISKAAEDAKIRAQKIAKFSGGKLGDLKSAKMGVFQITGQNSTEGYSWGGTFNTSSKKKNASITMKLVYKVD